MALPKDPFILLSMINMKLRDSYSSLDALCDDMDEDKNEIIDVIMDSAQTGEEGNSGDGRIFVVPIEEAYTISTRSKDD